MRIVFTGGGTGGHFYPIIAIAEQINKVLDENKIVSSKLYYFSDSPYDKNALLENGIKYQYVPAGKLRLYFSLRTIPDIFSTILGILAAAIKLFIIYPDVVVGKGGGSSFPTLFAARILNIPVIIHESDSTPGRVNKYVGKYAKRIALSYPEASEFFPTDRVAWTGQPVRQDLQTTSSTGAFEFLKLDPSIPVLLVLGGSQGANLINDIIVDALPELVTKYQIIHQVGVFGYKEGIPDRANIVLEKSEHKDRYHQFKFLTVVAEKMAGGAASLVITRAGSTLFEIALWEKPSIVIPITNSNDDHQRKNAYAFARAGACMVVEESNLSPHLLISDIDTLMKDETKRKHMGESARAYAKPDAALVIAREVVRIALSHEG